MRHSLLYAYSDEEFRKLVVSSHTHAECLRKIGYNTNSGNVQKAYRERIAALHIDTSHIKEQLHPTLSPEEVFVGNCTRSNNTVRRFYARENPPTVCAICSREPVWEDKPLTLILDHINGIHSDSRRENLRWVCPNCNSQLETTSGKNRNKRVNKVNQCVDCGKKISPKATRCTQCENNHRVADKMHKRHSTVTRAELKQLIRTTSLLQIGKRFNVSDNAVRKWCKAYGLPSRKSDIKQYSDAEWEQI